jgi:hypothetical protein
MGLLHGSLDTPGGGPEARKRPQAPIPPPSTFDLQPLLFATHYRILTKRRSTTTVPVQEEGKTTRCILSARGRAKQLSSPGVSKKM